MKKKIYTSLCLVLITILMGCGAKKDEVTVMAVQREVKTQAEKSSSEIELQREIEESSVGIKQTKETVEEIENILETTENVESNVISWSLGLKLMLSKFT